MQFANERKKAKQIETLLLNRLAVIGQHRLALLLGMNDAAVTRMKYAIGRQKHSLFETMSLAMALLEVQFPESNLEERLDRIEKMLTKKKAPTARTVEASQITLNF